MVILTSFEPPVEGVIHKEENTEAHISGKGSLGNGTLFIAESRVSWKGVCGEGFSLEYKAISMHAISRDLSAFPRPCLYLIIDADIAEEVPGGEGGSEDEEEESPVTEIRFAPQQTLALDAMYKAMSDCQQLHPDTDQSDEEDLGGAGEFYSDETGAHALSAAGQQQMQRLNNMLSNGSADGEMEADAGEEEPGAQGQFEDADMQG